MGRFIISLLYLMFFLSPPAHGEDDSTLRHAAAAAISSGHFGDALKTLDPLLKAHPLDPSLWTLRGLAFDGLGQTKESLASFDRALSIDKAFPPALEGALQSTYLHGDPRASQYAQRLLAVAPDNEVANAMAGAMAYQSHDCNKSAGYFGRSKDEVYRDQSALSEFADCLLQMKMSNQAVQVLTKGSQAHPESIQLRYNLALAELQDHNPAEAVRVLAPFSEEKDTVLLNLLASAYAQASMPDDAFRVLERAIAVDEKNESNYLDLAVLCLDHNQENCAVSAATAGIAQIPQAASLFLIRGVAYAQLDQYDKAESDFETAARIEPNQPHSAVARTFLYSNRNQVDKARELLTNQLRVTPNDAVTNFLLADLLVRSGAEPGKPEFNRAQAALAISLKARPDLAEAHILMATMLDQQSDPSGALDHIESALKVEPDNRSALNQKIVLLRQLHRNGELKEVVEHLKTVLNRELEQQKDPAQVRVAPRAPDQ